MIQHATAGTTASGQPARLDCSAELLAYARTILGGLSWPGKDAVGSLRTLGLSSCTRGEGVSTIAAHLAIAAVACSDQPVLLVDANLARPSAQHTFGVQLAPGLAEVLSQGGRLAEAIQASPLSRLSILAAGRLQGSMAQAYDGTGLAGVVAALQRQFVLTVFDLPAAEPAGPLVPLAGLLDGVLLVVEAEKVRWEAAQRLKEQLVRANVRLRGAVLNKWRHHPAL